MSALHRYSITTTIASVGSAADVHAIRIATPSTRRIRAVELEVSTAGVNATDNPARVRVLRGVTSGFSAGTGATPVPIDPAMPASLCTGTTQMTGTPTGGTAVFDNRIAAAATLAVIPFPLETQPVVAVSSFLDVMVTGGGTTLSNVSVTITWEE